MLEYIGSFPMICLQGDIEFAQTMLEEITRPQIDGVAYRAGGFRGQQFDLRSTTDCIDAADADSVIGSYVATQTEIVDITIRGVTYGSFLVLHVGGFDRQQLINSVGGVQGGLYMLSATWTLIQVEV